MDDLKSFDNHSKLILMKTDANFYVVETSSKTPKTRKWSNSVLKTTRNFMRGIGSYSLNY